MTKSDIIADIRLRNLTATEEFLARFSEEDLLAYLSNLQEVVTVPAAAEHRRVQDRHSLVGPYKPVRAPVFRSDKPYMGRSTHVATICCAKRRRNHVQLG